MTVHIPYTLTQYRIDEVVRVPDWFVGTINEGDLVIRESNDTVRIEHKRFALDESNTKFWGYILGLPPAT